MECPQCKELGFDVILEPSTIATTSDYPNETYLSCPNCLRRYSEEFLLLQSKLDAIVDFCEDCNYLKDKKKNLLEWIDKNKEYFQWRYIHEKGEYRQIYTFDLRALKEKIEELL